MAKKKKKKKKSISILHEVDKNLNGTYDNLMKEIEDMQLKLNYADQKARKQAKKMAKKKKTGTKYYNYQELQKKARMEVVGEMENTNFLDRVMKTLNDVGPIIIVIGRLIASLILAILSLDYVKVNIKPDTLEKMDGVYKKAMSVK